MVIFKVNFVFDIEQLLSVVLLSATSILVLLGSNLLTLDFIDSLVLLHYNLYLLDMVMIFQCIYLLLFSFSLSVLDRTCWACWTCLKTLSINHEDKLFWCLKTVWMWFNSSLRYFLVEYVSYALEAKVLSFPHFQLFEKKICFLAIHSSIDEIFVRY